jgi:hypothetical protein
VTHYTLHINSQLSRALDGISDNMNGVEAAASLFGSEASDTDLFATLGTDTTSVGDPLPLNSDPHFLASEEQAYDPPSHAAIYDSSVLAEHSPSVVAHESVAETSNHVHDFNHQGQWAQGEKNNPTLSYSGEFIRNCF